MHRNGVSPSDIAAALGKKVFGQDEVIQTISEKIAVNMMRRECRLLTIGLIGPTATGKSQTARSVAEVLSELYEVPYGFIEIAGNEFLGEHSVNRFFGAPAGYVGHGSPTLLEPVRNNPYHVIVINEIEKADEKLLTGLMEAIDTGNLGMADNTSPIDLSRCVMFFTSNLPIDEEKYRLLDRFGKEELCRDEFTAFCGRPEISGKICNFAVFRSLDDKEFIENKYISSYVYKAPEGNDKEYSAILKKMNDFRHYTSCFGSEAELLDKINGKNKLLDNVRGVFPDYESGFEGYNSGSHINSIYSLEKAADYFAHGAYMLGMIRKSQGMNNDALKLLMRAAYRGHSEAQLEAGKLLFSMNNTQSEMFYRMSAESGNPEAMFRLSEICRADGRNDEALELCMSAADGGCFDAMHTAYVMLREKGDRKAAHYLSLYTEQAASDPMKEKGFSSEDGQIIGGHFSKINSAAKLVSENYTIFEAEDKNSPGTKRSIKQFTAASEKDIKKEVTVYKKIYEKLKGHSSTVPMMIESSIKQGYIVTEHFGSENILTWWEARTRPYRTAKQEYQSSIGSDMSRELKNVLKNNYLSAAATHKKHISELILLFRPLLDDIALMHNSGFMHCDIRCENIMYTEENGTGRLHLINFGMARTIPQVNSGDLLDRGDGCFPKDPFAEGAGKIGAEYDIYSICAVLFRLVAGRFPDDCINRAEQDRLLKEEGAGHSFREAVLRGLSRSRKRFEAVGYYDRNSNKKQENSLVYYLYHRSPANRVIKNIWMVPSAAAVVFLVIALSMLITPKTEREALADVSSLSSSNILRSDYEWKDTNLFNALAVYESENPSTEELLAENCGYIKTLVINNGRIMLLSAKEPFTDGFSQNELYNSEEFRYEKAPVVNKITSVEDIVQFFLKLTTLAVYNCPLAGKDTNGREYSALSELKELKYLRLNNCGYTNMSVFEGRELSALKWTEFSDNGRLDDLSPLCRLESLAELKAGNNEYVNISGLENAKNLRYLYLSNSSFDAEKLAGFTNIETFSARSISPKDTEYIKAMSKLKALYIHNVDFTGCTEKLGELVEELPELTKLSIGSCVFDSVDLLTEQLKKSGSLDTLYVSNTKFADGSELDVSKLFFINDVIHAPDYKWKDSGIRQLYSMTAGTDKIGFAERKNYAENIVSVVIEPSGLKCYDVDIHADTDLRRSEYLSTVTHIDADPDKKISLGDITELFPSASILVVRDTIIVSPQ